MTMFSEVSIVLTKQAYKKLLMAMSAITNVTLKRNLDALLSKAGIYRNKRDNTVLLYWNCVYWQWQTELVMDEVIWLQDFLTDLSDTEYRFIRITGECYMHFSGRLFSYFDPIPVVSISKRLDSTCEQITYPVLPANVA